MQDESTEQNGNEQLIKNLSAQDARIRMLSLHLLCEGYVDDPGVFSSVCSGWEEWGPDAAYEEFPMLTYIPIPTDSVEAVCKLAAQMAEGRKLTETSTRIAGKLIEQVCYLPPASLEQHVDLIEQTSKVSKIFFRVDLTGVRNRIQLSQLSADELAQQLDASVQSLSEDSNDPQAVHSGLHALESLRRQHADYMDLPAALSSSPPDKGPPAVSFQLILNSLTQNPDHNTIEGLEKHLQDPRESIYSMVVEALVRARSDAAINALLRSLPSAPVGNQRWIARGLQRIRVGGYSQHITNLRNSITDPALWLMLLIAEVRQFDIAHVERLASEVNRIQTLSEPLIDSLTLYLHAFESDARSKVLQTAMLEYLQRANNSVAKKLKTEKTKLEKQDKNSRAKLRKKIMDDYRKQN